MENVILEKTFTIKNVDNQFYSIFNLARRLEITRLLSSVLS
jgi:hypothetical protein